MLYKTIEKQKKQTIQKACDTAHKWGKSRRQHLTAVAESRHPANMVKQLQKQQDWHQQQKKLKQKQLKIE